MELRRTRIAPVVGGITAAATAVGAFAPATQVAVAAPDNVDGAVSPLGVAQEGVFESCSAYFGFGKEAGGVGVVGFDVADVDGDDPTAHAVPDDTDVVLVLENEAGDVLECIPEEVTQIEWDGWMDDLEYPNAPAWPGAAHYVYPNVSLEPEIADFGVVTAVGFRVVGVPGDHTLVSPEGVQPLVDHLPDPDEFFDSTANPDVLALVEAAAGPDAAAAFAAAFGTCDGGGELDTTDEDLIAAVQAIIDHLGHEETIVEADCGTVGISEVMGAYALAVDDTAVYEEPIRLSVPTPQTPTTAAPVTPAPAAQAAAVTPTYTG